MRAAGWRTGLYTSPHLMRYNERVRIAGRRPPTRRWSLRSTRSRTRGPATGRRCRSPTSSSARSRRSCCSRGARPTCSSSRSASADGSTRSTRSTRTCAIVTSIDLDHRDLLGDTRESIGREGGRLACRLVRRIAEPDPPAIACATRRRASARGGSTWRDVDFTATEPEGIAVALYRGPGSTRGGAARIPRCEAPTSSRTRRAAIAAIDALRDRLPVSVGAMREGCRHRARGALPGAARTARRDTRCRPQSPCGRAACVRARCDDGTIRTTHARGLRDAAGQGYRRRRARA